MRIYLLVLRWCKIHLKYYFKCIASTEWKQNAMQKILRIPKHLVLQSALFKICNLFQEQNPSSETISASGKSLLLQDFNFHPTCNQKYSVYILTSSFLNIHSLPSTSGSCQCSPSFHTKTLYTFLSTRVKTFQTHIKKLAKLLFYILQSFHFFYSGDKYKIYIMQIKPKSAY